MRAPSGVAQGGRHTGLDVLHHLNRLDVRLSGRFPPQVVTTFSGKTFTTTTDSVDVGVYGNFDIIWEPFPCAHHPTRHPGTLLEVTGSECRQDPYIKIL